MTTIQDPCAPLVVVRANQLTSDPAIDWTATDAEEYRKTRDLELLKPKGSEQPVKFCLRRMPASFVLQALENISTGEKTLVSIRAALFRIELPGGTVLTPKKTTKQLGCEVADEEWPNELSRKFGISTLYEMASVAINFAGLPEDQRGPFA